MRPLCLAVRIVFLAFLLACPAWARDPQAVVVWLSIDALRGDYAEKTDAPELKKLMAEGAFSRHLIGTFPTLTFPSHVAQATGTCVADHGIAGNTFFDVRTGSIYNMPNESSLVEAEPIWVTAARQGVRSIVFDWPMSYAQQGQWHATKFGDAFDKHLTDSERYNRLLDAWDKDTDGTPQRLLMGYGASVDGAGHQFGPDSPQLTDAVRAIDAEVAKVKERAITIFNRQKQEGDQLYLILTGDHGMRTINAAASYRPLIGELPAKLRMIDGGTMTQIFLNDLDPNDRKPVLDQIAHGLEGWKYGWFLRREDYPAHWNYTHPFRTPDALILAKPGYVLNGHPGAAPTTGPSRTAATHGYPVEECPQMQALLIIWRYPQPLGGKDLGEVGQLSLHPTVANLLGIKPSEKAKAPRLMLEP